MKKLFWIFAVALLAFTACTKEKTEDSLTPEMLAGLWETEYAESGTDGEESWTRVVEDYQFNADGTGYYECYQLDGNKYVKATSVRDNGTLHFTISDKTVTVKGDQNNMTQTLSYADGKLTAQGKTWQRATEEQKTLVDQLYADWQGSNSGSSEIGYIECSWDGTQVVKTAKVVNAKDIRTLAKDECYSGVYYISGSYTMDGYLGVLSGKTLDLILCDGAEFKPKEIGMLNNSTLRIYGQDKGTGKLTIIDPEEGFAGIGTNQYKNITIEIHGGDITARGYNGAAGIGCGWWDYSDFYKYYGCVKSIIIYGGSIKATGGSSAAGIGTGYRTKYNTYDADSGTITIYGGDVSAKGGGYYYGVGSDYNFDGGAGIGSGIHSKLESVNIYGGNVIALGGHKAPGIGARGDSGEINIYGGHVKAGGGQNGAGIGGARGGYVTKVNIHGGTVEAYAGADGAGIGGGENGDSGDITITGGTVRAYGNKQIVTWESFDKVTIGNNSGYGAGIGSGQDGSVNTIIIKGGDIAAYGGEDAAGIGTGEEFTKDGIISGTIEIHGGKVWAEGGGYGAGIGAGEDATFGVLGISGGRVDAHAGEDCYPWSGGIGAYHDDHEDGCHIGWAGWERIYIGKGMRLWTYSPNVGGVENVTNNLSWWDFVHQRPQVAFGECDHAGYTEATCPFCYRSTLQLR